MWPSFEYVKSSAWRHSLHRQCCGFANLSLERSKHVAQIYLQDHSDLGSTTLVPSLDSLQALHSQFSVYCLFFDAKIVQDQPKHSIDLTMGKVKLDAHGYASELSIVEYNSQ